MSCLRKRSFDLDCLAFCGLCVFVHASSSAGESVFFISESLTSSHSVFMVHMSCILLLKGAYPSGPEGTPPVGVVLRIWKQEI